MKVSSESTPGKTDKSQIWLVFKEFHRRLELTQFYQNQPPVDEIDIDQEIIDFLNENAGNPVEDKENRPGGQTQVIKPYTASKRHSNKVY